MFPIIYALAMIHSLLSHAGYVSPEKKLYTVNSGLIRVLSDLNRHCSPVSLYVISQQCRPDLIA